MPKHFSAGEKHKSIMKAKAGKHMFLSRRLSPREKLDLICRYLSGEKITHLCKEAGVSRTIFYKWITIYQQNEQAGVTKQLAFRIRRRRRHYRAISLAKENEIVKLAIKDPSFSLRKIASLAYVSRHCVWTTLRRHNLDTPQSRVEHVFTIGRRLKLPLDAATKLTIIRRLENGEKASVICRDLGISRTAFYHWYQRYTQANSAMRQTALGSRRPKGEKHYRYVNEARHIVLKIVQDSPHLSIRNIQQELCVRTGKQMLSRHGVHTILRAHNLNSLEKRVLFAKAQKEQGTTKSLV